MKTIRLLMSLFCVFLLVTPNANSQETKKKRGAYPKVEQMPEFPGGELALRKFIAQSVRYPVEAQKSGKQGKVYVSFIVNKKGEIKKPKIARGVDPLLDNEALRVINALPTWKPGKQKGKPVNVSYTVPINFVLNGKEKKETKTVDGETVFFIVEEMPEFPGGESALREFIANSVRYPVEAKQNGIQGKVYVTFVVGKDGAVKNSKIARSVDPSLDKEALRVIDALPVWKPGKQRGEAVNVSYTVPINFVLNGKEKKETKTVDGEMVFFVVEEMPEFPGGFEAMKEFLAKTVKYPDDAKKAGINGKVFVSFVVDEKGKVTNAKIERAVYPSLDKEAIRVVNLMPDWKPGKQKGETVKVAFTVPIQFALQ